MRYLFLIIKVLTGRDIKINSFSDLIYVLHKGGAGVFRGFFWHLMRGRVPNGMMLGTGVRILDGRNIDFGKGVFIGANSYFDCSADQRVKIGSAVTFREGCWLQCRSGLNEKGEGLYIGDNVYIGPYAIIGVGGLVFIGNHTQIGGRLSISAESHVKVGEDYVGGKVARKGIRIGERCWIGNGVTILDGVEIGSGCVIGAGSVVTKSIKKNSIAYGVPASIKNNESNKGCDI